MQSVIFLLLVLQTCTIDSFLVNSSQTGLTSFEFQHLLQLILNEEQSRHHVENEVTSIEQRVAEIENDLKTKYEQDIAATKTTMELQLNATKTKLEQEASATKTLLEHEINSTKMVLEHQTYALEKEKSNRRQLEREYTRLMIDFQNLSFAYNDLVMKHTGLDETIGNQTKTFISKCETLQAGIEAVNQSNILLQTNVSAIQTEMPVYRASIASNLAKISELTTRTDSLNATTGLLKQKTGYQSAFSVTGSARNGTNKGTIILTGVKYNSGGHYNISSGRFTCVYSGVYMFSLNLYKDRSAVGAWCWIRKNGAYQVIATAEPKDSAPEGWNEGSGSFVTHLAKGDYVDLGECTSASSIYHYSSFSGTLIQPD